MSKRGRAKQMPELELAIEGLNHDGRGVARKDGKVQFIFGALPDEIATCQITKQNRRYNEGRALEIAQPNPGRVAAKCPHFGVCGGCWLQHAAISTQHAHKCAALRDLFSAQQITINPKVLASGNQYSYRRKARLSVRFVAKKNKVLVGFREHAGRFVANINECPILEKSAEQLLIPLSELIYNLDSRQTIPQIEVAVGENATALIVRHLEDLSTNDLNAWKNFAKTHLIQLYLQPKGPDTIHPLWPDAPEELYYTNQNPDLKFNFHPASFIQINADVNKQLINLATKYLQVSSGDIVLDLFCGIGNFSLPLAIKAKKLIGIEGDENAVIQARKNAKLNDINNCEFFSTDLTIPDNALKIFSEKIDAMLLDPPRSGAKELIPLLNTWQPERICYISCSQATIARDSALILEAGYELKDIGVVDLFPQTAHAETIAFFTRVK